MFHWILLSILYVYQYQTMSQHAINTSICTKIYALPGKYLWIAIGNTRIWHFDLLEIAWHYPQASIVTLLQPSHVVLCAKSTIFNVQHFFILRLKFPTTPSVTDTAKQLQIWLSPFICTHTLVRWTTNKETTIDNKRNEIWTVKINKIINDNWNKVLPENPMKLFTHWHDPLQNDNNE